MDAPGTPQADTQIIGSKSLFRVGTTARFDYTQTYLMTTNPTASVLGDTTYNVHETPTKTFLDWVMSAQRGGFFFSGASINFKGELRGTKDSGHAEHDLGSRRTTLLSPSIFSSRDAHQIGDDCGGKATPRGHGMTF